MPSQTSAQVAKPPEFLDQTALTRSQGWAGIFLRYFFPRVNLTTSISTPWPKIWPRDSCLGVRKGGTVDRTWTCGLVWHVLACFVRPLAVPEGVGGRKGEGRVCPSTLLRSAQEFQALGGF